MPFSFTIPSVFTRKSCPHSYQPVPTPDEETLVALQESKATRVLAFERKLFLDLSFWLTAFAVLSVAVTIRNLLVIQLSSQGPHVSFLEASIGNPYNGLEKLVRNESSPSWPLSSTHYPDFIGVTVASYIHHGLGDDSIVQLDLEHTIFIQHRVRDYGLEHCAVKLELSRSIENEHGPTARGHHGGESPYLRLWRLEDTESKAVLAPSALPTSLPLRREFLGDIVPDGTRSMRSPFFRCNMGFIQTLEIAVACASDPCTMELRLTHSSPQRGFVVIQTEQELAPS